MSRAAKNRSIRDGLSDWGADHGKVRCFGPLVWASTRRSHALGAAGTGDQPARRSAPWRPAVSLSRVSKPLTGAPSRLGAPQRPRRGLGGVPSCTAGSRAAARGEPRNYPNYSPASAAEARAATPARERPRPRPSVGTAGPSARGGVGGGGVRSPPARQAPVADKPAQPLSPAG
ncbi:translation initiation factor IF-2-like [Meles meles]|uniref:translation initiation factor IF-2-like n=1 Tax=Meles meles TaxID=9662 RepID=UPI001E6A06F4|nr:translation initiation factor IF-2-like [Meles meles]